MTSFTMVEPVIFGIGSSIYRAKGMLADERAGAAVPNREVFSANTVLTSSTAKDRRLMRHHGADVSDDRVQGMQSAMEIVPFIAR